MNINSKRQVYTLLTNKVSSGLLKMYDEILLSLTELSEVFIVYHSKDDFIPEEVLVRNHFIFKDEILSNSGYSPIQNTLIPGSNHFPLLLFYMKYPSFDYYWYIEDDVRFTGRWSHLFNGFNNNSTSIDFISSHLRWFDEEPNWYWWNTLHNNHIFVPWSSRLRSFNPIMRLSQSALSFIHNALFYEKWVGHHEVLIPTLLILEGFAIADFGGEGSFVTPGMKNIFYTEDSKSSRLATGTMRFRPVILELTEVNKLYHPVKH